MKTTLLAAAFFSTLCFACGENEQPGGSGKKDSIMDTQPKTRVEILDPEGNSIIDSSAKVEELAGGFTWTEGPQYIADGDYLLFSDIPANKIMKWKDGEGVSTWLEPSGYTGPKDKTPKHEPGSNALILDQQGRLVMCQHGDRRMARMNSTLSDPRPAFTTIADKYQGKRLNSPNDAVYHPNGNLYFTDPPYGLDGGNTDKARELPYHGVYRVTPEGKIDLFDKEIDYPNGIAVTPDGKYLLVGHSNPDTMVWMKYALNDEGLASSKAVFYQISKAEQNYPGAPDGMKMHSKGYLIASGPGGIWIFNPAAKPIARIYTGQATSNCALTSDEKTLFMTCDDYLYRVKLK